MHQLLFVNTHPSRACDGTGFDTAIFQSVGSLEWASMATLNGRYFGIASKCRLCPRVCRIAWNRSSTAHRMQTQRAVLASWLRLPYEEPAPPNAVPVVRQRDFFGDVVEPPHTYVNEVWMPGERKDILI